MREHEQFFNSVFGLVGRLGAEAGHFSESEAGTII